MGLLGIWIDEEEKEKLNLSMKEIKTTIWGKEKADKIVFHREEMIHKSGDFIVLKDEKNQKLLDEWLLVTLKTLYYKVSCVIVDKKYHKQLYNSPFHPYCYCLQAMLDRFCGWLNHNTARGKVVAEEVGESEDQNLKTEYINILRKGTLLFPHDFHDKCLIRKELEIKKKKHNVPGLQLADMLAHPLRTRILFEKGIFEKDCGQFGCSILKTINNKLNRNDRTGEVWGYGKVCLSFEMTNPLDGGLSR